MLACQVRKSELYCLIKMKRIVTHKASDLDAIASSWIIKKFLPGWDNAVIDFVPAGSKFKGTYTKEGEAIEVVDGAEVIHTDTGMGPLDHHQTNDDNVCATSRAFDYVLENGSPIAKNPQKKEALRRMVDYVIDDDHFQEVFYQNPMTETYDFSIVSLIHGIKLQYPKDDATCLRFGHDMMDAAYHYFENKIWAEEEIKEKGIKFETRWGKGIAIETLNDTVLKHAQQVGYVISVRKDPATNSIRIKARPKRRSGKFFPKGVYEDVDVDLTPVYEKLKKMDPDATWYNHVSGRMLLNGSTKNPEMNGTKLTLEQVVEVLKSI